MTKSVVQALVDSVIVFFLPLQAYMKPMTVWAKRGYSDGLYVFGTVVYACLIMAMMMKVFNMTRVSGRGTRCTEDFSSLCGVRSATLSLARTAVKQGVLVSRNIYHECATLEVDKNYALTRMMTLEKRGLVANAECIQLFSELDQPVEGINGGQGRQRIYVTVAFIPAGSSR